MCPFSILLRALCSKMNKEASSSLLQQQCNNMCSVLSRTVTSFLPPSFFSPVRNFVCPSLARCNDATLYLFSPGPNIDPSLSVVFVSPRMFAKRQNQFFFLYCLFKDRAAKSQLFSVACLSRDILHTQVFHGRRMKCQNLDVN